MAVPCAHAERLAQRGPLTPAGADHFAACLAKGIDICWFVCVAEKTVSPLGPVTALLYHSAVDACRRRAAGVGGGFVSRSGSGTRHSISWGAREGRGCRAVGVAVWNSPGTKCARTLPYARSVSLFHTRWTNSRHLCRRASACRFGAVPWLPDLATRRSSVDVRRDGECPAAGAAAPNSRRASYVNISPNARSARRLEVP
jgi:hypothetical protein